MTAGRHARAGYAVGNHDLADIAVIVSCSCGELFAGDSHEHAMAQWDAHAAAAVDAAEAEAERPPPTPPITWGSLRAAQDADRANGSQP